MEELLHGILNKYPEGLNEYALFDELKEQRDSGFDDAIFESELSLFQNHFLLFHCLYRLRDRLLSDVISDIEIHCLKIKLVPVVESDRCFPARHDPLRDYYLDLSHLKETTAEDVDALLNSFWQRYVAYDNRSWALQVLELEEEVSFEEIQARYRKLVMKHHPDRNGDTAKLQAINEAMAHLKTLYK